MPDKFEKKIQTVDDVYSEYLLALQESDNKTIYGLKNWFLKAFQKTVAEANGFLKKEQTRGDWQLRSDVSKSRNFTEQQLFELHDILLELNRTEPKTIPELKAGIDSLNLILQKNTNTIKENKMAMRRKYNSDEKLSRFEKGVPADPTENMSEEDAETWKEMNEKYQDVVKDMHAKKALAHLRRLADWESGHRIPDKEIPSEGSDVPNEIDPTIKRAAGGLYGYTKGIESACQMAAKKIAKASLRIAKNIYAKDERVADFLLTHSKRAKSLPARVLCASLKELGPFFGQNAKSAGSTEYGLYGYPDKVAKFGLYACADLRYEVGKIASELHGRQSFPQEKLAGFLAEHCKATKCAYTRLLHASYPDILLI